MKFTMRNRFRGFIPIVVDVETAGFEADTDALLEIALSPVVFAENSTLEPTEPLHFHIKPFIGANLDKDALEFNKIDPTHPFRFAITEKEALTQINLAVSKLLKKERCSKAILVGHNAHFDLGFLNAAYKRNNIKSTFHAFSCLDTATLSALAFGETVLAKALYKAKIKFDHKQAHSALYDTEVTAQLFCLIFNNYNLI
jgi:ribonuclease T